jgi:hypothetical protein
MVLIATSVLNAIYIIAPPAGPLHLEAVDLARGRIRAGNHVVTELLGLLLGIWRSAVDVEDVCLTIVFEAQLGCHTIAYLSAQLPEGVLPMIVDIGLVDVRHVDR